jgi:uncharacterized protein
MKFTEHRDSNVLTVKKYEPNHVTINDIEVTDSCYLNHHTLKEHWACHQLSELNTDRLDELLSLSPEVIILGTGEKQQFPDPKIFYYCAQKGVGLEVMANDAACRTYNVLTTEDREVVLALIFEKADR